MTLRGASIVVIALAAVALAISGPAVSQTP